MTRRLSKLQLAQKMKLRIARMKSFKKLCQEMNSYPRRGVFYFGPVMIEFDRFGRRKAPAAYFPSSRSKRTAAD